MRSLAIVVLLLLTVAACRGRESSPQDETTATIAPAQPQPVETGTDAMTQTIELGDGRSVSEGGANEEGTTVTTIDAATAPRTENPTTTASTTTTTTTSTTTR